MMRVVATETGIQNLLILMGLQGVKEGTIKAYYSGTIRRFEVALNKADIMRCIEGFFAMAVAKYPAFITIVDPDEVVDNAQVCFDGLTEVAGLRYMPQTDLYALDGLYIRNFYMATESNPQTSGVLLWGLDGLGATCDSYLHDPIPFDDGVTVDQWLAQFPNHRVGGNDVVLSLGAADAIRPLITGWDPHLNVLVADFRAAL